VQLTIGNPLTGLDALAHGWDNLKGWGANPSLDATLLSVRRFNASSQQFEYEVNQRFGETRAQLTQRVAPFQIGVNVSYDIAPERQRQQLNLDLRRGRLDAGQKANETTFLNRYKGQVRSPFNQLLQQVDTLKLTDEQADSIAVLNKAYTNYQDSLWTPIARYLANLPNDYDPDEAWARVKEGFNKNIERLAVMGPAAKGLLTKQQINALPPLLNQLLDEHAIRAMRPGNAGGQGRLGGG
jgi:hypothetical protein